ncbi:MAG: DUF4279 domain-containing protein [Rhodothermia bacterium]|nr:DUF4279 domain-containing protein [Rhodothermia bacterium]
MKHTEIKLIFSVFGDFFDPHELTEYLQVKPSSIHTKGNPIHGRNNLFYQESAWDFTVLSRSSLDVESITEEFLSIFLPKMDKIAAYTQKNSLRSKIFLVIKIQEQQTPSIYLNTNFIKFLERIKAEVDCDLFYSY